MKVDNTRTYNPDFTSIYRIKHSSTNDVKFMKTLTENKEFSKLVEDPMLFTLGKSPLDVALIYYVSEYAKKLGYCVEWLLQNAQRFGKTLPNSKDSEALLIVGEHEIFSTGKFVLSIKTESQMGFFKLLKYKYSQIKKLCSYTDIPDHLRLLFFRADEIDEIGKNFEKSMQKDKCEFIDVDTLSEALAKILTGNK